MTMAMMMIDKETKERQLLWTPDMNEIDVKDEIYSALDSFGDTVIELEDGTITGERYHIVFEQIG
jgi:hypothetical protein